MRHVITVLLLLWIAPTTINAAVILVPTDYATITEAISAAADGDEIIVAPGTYMESVDFSGKAIYLHSSDGPGVTTIDAGSLGPAVSFVSGEGTDSILEGFTIREGVGIDICGFAPPCIFQGGGVNIVGSSPIITGNIIMDNESEGAGVLLDLSIAGGMYVDGGAPFVTYNLFFENYADVGGGGVYLLDSNATLENNTFVGNESDEGAGLLVLGGAPLVRNNIFWDNLGATQIFDGGSALSVTYCDVQGGYAGTGNIDADPLFVDSGNMDFNLQLLSPCVDAGDPSSPFESDGTPVDLGAYSTAGLPSMNFKRGDCNNDGTPNIADAVFALGMLFPGGGMPTVAVCEDSCDANDDGEINIADAVALLGSLFGSPPLPLPLPGAACGADLTVDTLDCPNGGSGC